MLLESTRDYAAWRLAEAGEAALIERRHAHVVADLLEPLRADWEVLRDEDWIARYRPERPNARAALGHAMRAEEPDLLARLVAAMGLIDAFDNDHPEIAALPLPMALLGQALPSCRGPALLELSWAHQGIGRRDRGIDCAQRALADFNAVGDSAGACRALAQLVRLHESRPGGRDEARHALAAWRAIDAGGVPQRTRLWCRIMAGMQYGGERTLDGLRDLEDAALRCGFDGLVAVSRLHITDQLLVEGRDDEVLQATEACLQAGEPRPRVKATLLHNRAQALLRLGRLAQARDTEVAALHARGRLSLMSLSTLVLVAAREGRHRDAATIAGWMQRELHARGLLPDPVDAAFFDEAEALLRAALPAPRLAELMRAGAALPAAALLAQVTAEPASPVETELRRVV